MKKITILLILLILVQSEEQQFVEMDNQLEEVYEEIDEFEAEEDEYFKNYTTYLDGFLPQETFLLRLEPNQQDVILPKTQNFMVRIPSNCSQFRGLFYADTEEHQDMRVEIWHQNTLLQSFQHKRMHIMNVNNPQQGYLTLRTFNNAIPKYVYYSMEAVTAINTQKPPIAAQFRGVHSNYLHIFKSISKRQFMLETLIRQNRHHMEKLQNSRHRALHLAIFQTVILITSCLLSVYLLYKTIKRQSQFVI